MFDPDSIGSIVVTYRVPGDRDEFPAGYFLMIKPSAARAARAASAEASAAAKGFGVMKPIENHFAGTEDTANKMKVLLERWTDAC